MLFTQKDFADYCGVSKQAIGKAIKKHHLVLRQDGKLDTDNPINQDYIRKKGKEIPTKSTTNASNSKKKPRKKVTKKTPQKQQNIPVPQTPEDDENGTSNDLLKTIVTKNALDVQKTLEQVKHLQVKTSKERGELISRDIVKLAFAKLFKVDTGELRTLGAKLAPDIASIFGISDDAKILEAKEYIEEEVFVVLKHIKRIYADALKTIDVDAESVLSDGLN